MTAPSQHPQRCKTCAFGEHMKNGRFHLCKKYNLYFTRQQYWMIIQIGCASHSATPARNDSDVQQLKDAIIEVLDTGFESSERDMVLVLDRIDAWQKGELRQQQGEQP